MFGPYVNRNHFAGYLVMALPLALGFAAESAGTHCREAWRRRRVGWLALARPPATAADPAHRGGDGADGGTAGGAASRGGLMAFAVSAASFPLAFPRRHRRLALLAIVLVTLLGTAWVGVTGPGARLRAPRAAHEPHASSGPTCCASRPAFPALPLGAGLNSFGMLCTPSTRRCGAASGYGEAHNEYLQALIATWACRGGS